MLIGSGKPQREDAAGKDIRAYSILYAPRRHFWDKAMFLLFGAF